MIAQFVLFVGVFACITSTVVSADSLTISGRVLDTNREAIGGAVVRVHGGGPVVRSQRDGRFQLALESKDSARLVVRLVGYYQKDTVLTGIANRDHIIVLWDSTMLARGVVVTGARANEYDPVTQSTVSAEDLKGIYLGQDPQFLLERLVPATVATSESGAGVSNYGSFRIRGIDQTRVNITVDGTPLNDMIDQGVFFSNFGDLANGMSSVYVQRGVGVSTNGTASFAGSVDFEGANLSTSDARASVQLMGASYGTQRASATVATGKMDNNVSMLARFTSMSSDGYRHHTGTKTNSLYITGAWFGENDVIRATAIWGRARNQLGYYAVPKPLAEIDPRINLNDSSDTDDFGQYLLQVQHSHAASASVVITSTIYAGGAGGDYFTGFRGADGDLTIVNYPLENRHYGIQTSVRALDVVDGLDITGGLHAYTFRRRNWETASPELSRPYYQDTTRKNEVSAFARAQYRLGSAELFADLQVRSVHLSFAPDAQLSVSANTIPTHSWLFVNPRAGARYHVSDASSFYASVGITGREPTRFDLLGSTQITDANLPVLLVPGTVLPEYVTDIEVGFDWKGAMGTLSVNGFAMMFTDEIAPIGPFIEQGFVQLRKNVPSSRRLGLEVDGRLELSTAVSFSGTLALTHAVVDEYAPENAATDTVFSNVAPVLTPPIVANVVADVRPLPWLTVQLAGRYISRSWADLSNAAGLTIPEVVQADARVWCVIAGSHRLGLLANNVFDGFVVTSGGSAAYQGAQVPTYFVQAGRNFAVVAELHF